MSQSSASKTGFIQGISASEGIAIGRAWILKSPWDEVKRFPLEDHQIESELKRYRACMKSVNDQLVECRDHVQKEIGKEESKIFNAHLAILKDPFFQDEIPLSIESKKFNAEAVLKDGIDQLTESFRKMENEFFRHRADDIQDVAIRFLRVLYKTEAVKISPSEDTILVAHNLIPSDTARIDPKKILGFATEMGGNTSHASILARSIGIPAVVGAEHLMDNVKNGDLIVLDGHDGTVQINPDAKALKEYRKQKDKFSAYLKKMTDENLLASETLDGVEISLYANVSMITEADLAVQYRADGIGLFRTELPFLIAGNLLPEEEQFQIYKKITESMDGKVVTIRTLDLGGDKFLPFDDVKQDRNPFLGWRSIRIFLQEKDIFKSQLRAILRASHFGNVRILYPMISSYEEIRDIYTLIDEAKDELRKQGVPFDESVQQGVMIEVPSAAICAHRLINHCDFLSIGTNDLIQYTLAVDRNNERVARFYQPTNPAILTLISGSITAAKNANKAISLCGEMGGNVRYVPMLIGMGLRDLSMSPSLIPEVKERIRAVTIKECEELTQKIMTMVSSEEIEKELHLFHEAANNRQAVPLPTREK